MKLNYINPVFNSECTCELTKELDVLSKLNEKEFYDVFYHYIVADAWCKGNKCLALRVQGGTVGGIWFDANNVITKIVIDTEYVVKTYPSDVNEIMKKYVGCIIEF